jgi:hypothetical protein
VPQIFQLPQVVPLSSLGAILPGAKLYFFATGTSTPQSVYTDVALTTPHSQPVVASGSGVFAPIYLDGSMSNYRVRLTDANDVQLWQLDEIPATQNTAQNFRVKAAAPEIVFEETGVDAEESKSRIRVNAEVITWELLNSAENTAAEIIRVPRNGTSLGQLTIGGSTPLVGRAAYKGTSTERFSNTLESDTDLQLSLLGSSLYIVEGQLEFDATTSGAMGAKFALAYSGTLFNTTKANVSQFINGTGAVALATLTTGTPLAFATIGTSASSDQIRFSLALRTTTLGTLSMQWAQNSTTLTALNLRQGSWIRATRVT